MNDLQFEEFYSQYYDRIFKYILKKTADFHLAEDLAMDVFTACYKNYEKYDSQKASLGTWVYTITNNRLKNYYRDRKDFVALDEQTVSDEDMESTVIQASYTEYLRNALADALETLNEVQQAVIILKYFKGKNSSEIALALGLSSVNVRAISSRAVKQLKNYFVKNNIDLQL